MNVATRSEPTGTSGERSATWYLCVLKQLGYRATPGMRVLEIGCGNGELVHSLRSRGIDSFGCDLEFKNGPRTDQLREAGLLKIIETSPYRLPFDDRSFDLVVSVSVLEHVLNLEETVREISRVTRLGGVGLHMFPSRDRLVEPHTFVPLATLFRARWWLRFWASVGLKNSSQAHLSSSEIAEANHKYLHESTSYLSRSGIFRTFRKEFAKVMFCEGVLVWCAAGSLANRMGIGGAMRRFTVLARLYSAVRTRVIWVQKD